MVKSIYDYKFLKLLDEVKLYLDTESNLDEKSIEEQLDMLKMLYLDFPVKKDNFARLSNFFSKINHKLIISQVKKLAKLKKFETFLNALKLNLSSVSVDEVLDFARKNHFPEKKVYKAYSYSIYKTKIQAEKTLFCEY